METDTNQWHSLTPSRPSAEHLIPGLYALARCWYDRGDLAPAEKIYRLILSIDDRVPGIKCGEVVLSSLDLANVLADTGRDMEAEHQYLQTLNRCNQYMGQDHPAFGMTLNAYGALLRKMKMDEQAENIEKRASNLKHESCDPERRLGGTNQVSSMTIT
ncbi:MAG: tetratricopeptide repeat protein [Candidatus Obscuribacterales bacterium]|nr:tetratricopeptide repeat protein [Candidatus Obscuribacterales bacterium]